MLRRLSVKNLPLCAQPSVFLFLGTRNSERSIFAEYLLRSLGGDRFEVSSAGETPKGGAHPIALKILRENFKIDTTGAVANSWHELADRDFDFVITLSDDARERSPVFPGMPVTAHWSIEDPTAFEGSEEEKYEHFLQTAFQIKRRIELLACRRSRSSIGFSARPRCTRFIRMPTNPRLEPQGNRVLIRIADEFASLRTGRSTVVGLAIERLQRFFTDSRKFICENLC